MRTETTTTATNFTSCNFQRYRLALLHSERPKLYGVLRAIGFTQFNFRFFVKKYCPMLIAAILKFPEDESKLIIAINT